MVMWLGTKALTLLKIIYIIVYGLCILDVYSIYFFSDFSSFLWIGYEGGK